MTAGAVDGAATILRGQFTAMAAHILGVARSGSNCRILPRHRGR